MVGCVCVCVCVSVSVWWWWCVFGWVGGWVVVVVGGGGRRALPLAHRPQQGDVPTLCLVKVGTLCLVKVVEKGVGEKG